ncbi:MAG: hypothetical protein HYV63_04625 [Candidatus Schekmanbacteria bacterium]|nr:hypothetical protein [Candidatus Schekmanbacteria bacterium]
MWPDLSTLLANDFSLTTRISSDKISIAMISSGTGLSGGTNAPILNVAFSIIGVGTSPLTLAAYYNFDKRGRDVNRFNLADVTAQLGQFVASAGGVPAFGPAGVAGVGLAAKLYIRRSARRGRR